MRAEVQLDPRPLRRPRGEGGFTLTELLVALTVTVIGLAGLLALHVTTVKGNAGAGRSLEAINLAGEALEQIRTVPVTQIETQFNLITTTEWSPGEDLGTAVGRNGQQYLRLLYAVQVPLNPNLVRFRVQILWSDDGQVPTGPGDAEHIINLEQVRTRLELL